jgi:hypothetical protein
MVDVERLFRTLDELDAPVAWPDVERRHPGTPPPEGGSGRRILATVVALAVASAGIAIAVQAFRHAPSQQTLGSLGNGRTESTDGRCVHVETAGDFDGDGLQDRAVLFDEIPAEETCLQDVSPNLRIEVRFGSGDRFAAPFRYCNGGTCGGVFTSIDLDADGHDELGIDVGPGAAVVFVEFFRVDTDGIHPLVIQEPADRPFVKPGEAVLGGGFDSLSQSPVECRVGSDGGPELVSIHAEARGNPSTDPWLVHRTTMVLHGDRLVVTSTSEKAQPWSMTWTLFVNDCT